MEKIPIEDIGLIEDILPKSELEESRAWFRNSLNQLGQIFAEVAQEEGVQWDLLQKTSIGRILINKVIGNTQENSIWGKHVLTYGAFGAHDKSVTNHLFVLDDGKLITKREETKLIGADAGETRYSFQDGHSITIFTSTFSEAETILNNVIDNMNAYLEYKIPKINN